MTCKLRILNDEKNVEGGIKKKKENHLLPGIIILPMMVCIAIPFIWKAFLVKMEYVELLRVENVSYADGAPVLDLTGYSPHRVNGILTSPELDEVKESKRGDLVLARFLVRGETKRSIYSLLEFDNLEIHTTTNLGEKFPKLLKGTMKEQL